MCTMQVVITNTREITEGGVVSQNRQITRIWKTLEIEEMELLKELKAACSGPALEEITEEDVLSQNRQRRRNQILDELKASCSGPALEEITEEGVVSQNRQITRNRNQILDELKAACSVGGSALDVGNKGGAGAGQSRPRLSKDILFYPPIVTVATLTSRKSVSGNANQNRDGFDGGSAGRRRMIIQPDPPQYCNYARTAAAEPQHSPGPAVRLNVTSKILQARLGCVEPDHSQQQNEKEGLSNCLCC